MIMYVEVFLCGNLKVISLESTINPKIYKSNVGSR